MPSDVCVSDSYSHCIVCVLRCVSESVSRARVFRVYWCRIVRNPIRILCGWCIAYPLCRMVYCDARVSSSIRLRYTCNTFPRIRGDIRQQIYMQYIARYDLTYMYMDTSLPDTIRDTGTNTMQYAMRYVRRDTIPQYVRDTSEIRIEYACDT